MEFAELICQDALARHESCGGHFRTEYQTEEGEALRNDADFAHVAVWQYQGGDKAPLLYKEPLTYEEIHLAQRSYK
jgi:succinate dehydrogenase / fumarate reductase flavoprotein subunit